jgi:hypothetical protein
VTSGPMFAVVPRCPSAVVSMTTRWNASASGSPLSGPTRPEGDASYSEAVGSGDLRGPTAKLVLCCETVEAPGIEPGSARRPISFRSRA